MNAFLARATARVPMYVDDAARSSIRAMIANEPLSPVARWMSVSGCAIAWEQVTSARARLFR
jgi:hypothetical protein